MKTIIFSALFLLSIVTNAQTKNVLLEEYTGVHCGSCPMGSYYVDSMITKYPNLVAVALHSYSSFDAMFFLEIDTLFNIFSTGAPEGAVDRINPGGSSTNVAQYITAWDANIQTQLTTPALLTLTVLPLWNFVTRNISTQIDINIIANLPIGDYRINLYVVEDSVTGIGFGYDQDNYYNTVVGNPFYGLGDPIVGFVHRHVARALLPETFGQSGIIPSSPTSGQNFTTTINYTLPVSYNENRIKLIAFVSKFTSNHQGDIILNAAETPLLLFSGISNESTEYASTVFPNPSCGQFTFNGLKKENTIEVYDITGRLVYQLVAEKETQTINLSNKEKGIYFYSVTSSKSEVSQGKLILQ